MILRSPRTNNVQLSVYDETMEAPPFFNFWKVNGELIGVSVMTAIRYLRNYAGKLTVYVVRLNIWNNWKEIRNFPGLCTVVKVTQITISAVMCLLNIVQLQKHTWSFFRGTWLQRNVLLSVTHTHSLSGGTFDLSFLGARNSEKNFSLVKVDNQAAC